MFRLSKLLEKLEDKSEARFKSWFARNKAKLPMRIPADNDGWYARRQFGFIPRVPAFESCLEFIFQLFEQL